jgi:TonB family protein
MTGLIAAILLGLIPAANPPARQDAAQHERPSIIRKSGGVLQGSATKRVEPGYPPLAKAARVSGAVVVEVTLDLEGNVESARPVSGHPLLKESAVAAARQWKFQPTLLTGTAVRVIGTITFNFTMDPGPEDIGWLEKEVTQNPDEAHAHYKLGSAYYTAGRYNEAVVQLNEALRLEPDSAATHTRLGSVLGALKKYNEAGDSFREAIRIDPEYADAFAGLGMMDSMLHNYDAAIESYRRAIELEPRAETCFAMAMTYEAMKRPDAAITRLQEGLALDPTNALARYRLGHLYVEIGNTKAAREQHAALKNFDARLADRLLKEIER